MLIPARPSRDAARASSPGRWASLTWRNFGFRVIRASTIENLFGYHCTVQDETYGTLAILERKGLKRENVDALIGEGLAQLSKRTWSVLESDGELLHGGHNRTSLRQVSGIGWRIPARSSVAQNPTPAKLAQTGPQCWAAFRRQLVSEPARRQPALSDFARLTQQCLPWFSELRPSALSNDCITVSAPRPE
jgi:hypothetical protein